MALLTGGGAQLNLSRALADWISARKVISPITPDDANYQVPADIADESLISPPYTAGGERGGDQLRRGGGRRRARPQGRRLAPVVHSGRQHCGKVSFHPALL